MTLPATDREPISYGYCFSNCLPRVPCGAKLDGIANFAPSDLRAEFTQGASGSPPKEFSVGQRIASARGKTPRSQTIKALAEQALFVVEVRGVEPRSNRPLAVISTCLSDV